MNKVHLPLSRTTSRLSDGVSPFDAVSVTRCSGIECWSHDERFVEMGGNHPCALLGGYEACVGLLRSMTQNTGRLCVMDVDVPDVTPVEQAVLSARGSYKAIEAGQVVLVQCGGVEAATRAELDQSRVSSR
jgi:hypothetical protein